MLRYLETGSTDPFFNLAFEEYVFQNRREGDYLLLWQNDNAVIIGRHQNAEEEINRAFTEAHNISVVRRITGGGAVYHDLGNLNYSLISDSGNPEQLTMSVFTKPIIEALAAMGVAAECSGRNDITVGGRKISGNAQRLSGGRILHHGTLLFDSNIEMLSGALNADPTKFASKSAKSVRSRVGSLKSALPEGATLPLFWQKLLRRLSAGGLIREELSQNELREVERLCRSKYRSWEWNFGASPKYDRRCKKRFAGGSIEAAFSAAEGKITACAFFGDFMARRDASEAASALIGCRIEKGELAERLASLPLEDYFGGITADELLEVLLY